MLGQDFSVLIDMVAMTQSLDNTNRKEAQGLYFMLAQDSEHRVVLENWCFLGAQWEMRGGKKKYTDTLQSWCHK